MCLAIHGRVVDIVDEGNRLASVDLARVRRTVHSICRYGVDDLLLDTPFGEGRVMDMLARDPLPRIC